MCDIPAARPGGRHAAEIPADTPEPNADRSSIAHQIAHYHGRALRNRIMHGLMAGAGEDRVLRKLLLHACQPAKISERAFLPALLATLGFAGAVHFSEQCPRYPSGSQANDLRRIMADLHIVFAREDGSSREVDVEVKDRG